MGEILSEIGDLVFSLVIGYIGALEFLYVMRHLYHWSFRHAKRNAGDAADLQQLQQRMRNQLATAEEREALAGANMMQDGFRIDPQQPEIDNLKEQQRTRASKDERRKELEAELARQQQIEAETRKQLAEAEQKLAEQRKETEEAEMRKQQKEKEEEQRRQLEAEILSKQKKDQEREAAAEIERKLLEAEKQREEVQRKKEEAEREAVDNERRLIEAERQRVEEQRKKEEAEWEAADNERKFIEAERQREEEERRKEEAEWQAAENERKLIETERQREEEERRKEEAEWEAAENERKLIEAERQREEEERRKEEAEWEAEENERKLVEAERQREEEERRKEEAEWESAANERKLLEAERQREEEERKNEEAEWEAVENERKLVEAERQREEEERKNEEAEWEAVENERKLVEAERKRKGEQLNKEEEIAEAAENERRHVDIDRQNEEEQLRREAEEDRKAAEIVERLMDIEEERLRKNDEEEAAANEKKLIENERQMEDMEAERERDRQRELEQRENAERKQILIEENARKFLEAEQEMLELHQKMMEVAQDRQIAMSFDSAPNTPVVEEPCIKKTVAPRFDGPNVYGEIERPTQTVKTQFGQASDDSYSLTSKPLNFPGLSDEGSSVEPSSSPQSSFNTQLSEEATTGAEESSRSIAMQFPQAERQEPDGEDTIPPAQFSDDYLRSLDGIKHRPLVREDGSGRRRAFKKRRSSGSSNSSRESRTSREEELKMFTSLEEEENQSMQKSGSDYAPIKYSSEQTLKVKGHHRRHKRSPAKDLKTEDDNSSMRGSLEMLGEENTDPWGEVVPGLYKDTEFWKREKTMSIDEEDVDLDKTVRGDTTATAAEGEAATNVLKALSFEEASHEQNEEAISALQKQLSKEVEDKENDAKTVNVDNARSDTKTNLQASQNAEDNASPTRSSASSRLRRSPRMDEINQYEERWKESAANTQNTPSSSAVTTPTISVQAPADSAPWRDQHGLMLEGLSDFYDFTASVNRSSSRSNSRNPSPMNSPPTSPTPKDVSYAPRGQDLSNVVEIITATTGATSLIVYDDTGNLEDCEVKSDIADIFEALSVNVNTTEIRENLKKSSDATQVTATHDTISESNQVPIVLINTVNDDQTADAPTDMTELVQLLRADRNSSRSRSRTRSRSPLPTSNNIARSLEMRRNKLIKHNDAILEKLTDTNVRTDAVEACTSTERQNAECEDNMNLLVDTLRLDRSRSRSRSPILSPDNIQRSLQSRRNKLIQHNNEVFDRLSHMAKTPVGTVPDTPVISVEYVEAASSVPNEDEECSRQNMSLLVESLRVARSRSRSKSPMRIPSSENLTRSVETQKLIERNDEISEQLKTRYKTPESPGIDIASEVDDNQQIQNDHRQSRSRTPSRSRSPSPKYVSDIENPNATSDETCDNLNDNRDFHKMLNLEGSQNRTLSKNSEEMESVLAAKQRQLDTEALHKLKTANEETELRTLTPTDVPEAEVSFSETSFDCELQSPTTPDYDRTISEECQDVQRIKQYLLTSGFKRSTYVGESMDLGSEFEPMRREAARFRRSQSPSRSIIESECELEEARRITAEKHEIQNKILADLMSATGSKAVDNICGAKPKMEGMSLTEYERTFSTEVRDTQRLRDELLHSEFKRSTYVGESVDLSAQLENMRRETAEFRRSGSRSRSPLDELEKQAIIKIEEEAARRELQDQFFDEIDHDAGNFQDFSRHLNANFLNSDRRASDTALIQRPEILMQFEDNADDFTMDPDDYHHYRRYSLNQEQSVEEYPSDDYVFVSQVEVRTSTGTRTWLREDFYTDNFEDLSMSLANMNVNEESAVNAVDAENEEQAREEEDTDGSEDERQTVVDLEDEIDTDICDFGERGPADESHHEQSECEEAERELDQYAGRSADDWAAVETVEDILDLDEVQIDAGAAGGLGTSSVMTYDSDSMAIDQIYDDAIRNRKQSGILRDYDSILQAMKNNYLDSNNEESEESDTKLHGKGAEACATFLENERGDHEVRYLGDASVSARKSARLHARYGYVPLLQGNAADDINVDLNYKPKREYNWRKNFKLDEDETDELRESHKYNENNENPACVPNNEKVEHVELGQILDMRKYSLGGESVTLFSRSPEKDENAQNAEGETPKQEVTMETIHETMAPTEKQKKKKTKKKVRRDSKGQKDENKDEDDSETQIYSRRSSSLQLDTDSPKRKSRSRRSSKSSLTNEECADLFSPRGSVGFEDAFGNVTEERLETSVTVKKKTKKRKKARDSFVAEADIKEEHVNEAAPALIEHATVFSTISPQSASLNALCTSSPQNSICVTPTSTTSEQSVDESVDKQLKSVQQSAEKKEEPNVSTESTDSNATISTPSSSTEPTSPVDNFDIMKDANFYPLF